MDKDLEQSSKEEQWVSYSDGKVSQVASQFSKLLENLGINNSLGESIGWSYIQSSGFNIRFYPTDYGCEMHIYIWKENKNTNMFRAFWKYIVDKDIVWGGPYKKDLTTRSKKQATKDDVTEAKSTRLKLPWEHMEGATADEIELVKIWCTQKYKGKELEEKTIYVSPSNILNRLRKEYPDAKIPKGPLERKRFLEQYLQQQLDSKKVKLIRKSD